MIPCFRFERFWRRKMAQLLDQIKILAPFHSIGRCTISCIFVLLTQFTVSLVPRFFSASPFLIQLSLSGLFLFLVAGSGKWCRLIFRVHGSAPALVFFNILFVWCFYIAIVRQAIWSLMDALFNGEVAVLIIGFCSILVRDPGLVKFDPSCSELARNSRFEIDPPHMVDPREKESTLSYSVQFVNSHPLGRVRYCKSCKVYIKGFDHHCAAFGNCIGQNNYALFMVLLLGFIITEATYLLYVAQFVRKSQHTNRNWSEKNLARNLAAGTMLFTIIQLLWQGVFLMWHIYCVCFNLKTDEWINWKKYSEFHVFYCEPGENITRMRFRNPYDKGIVQNVKDFVSSRE